MLGRSIPHGATLQLEIRGSLWRWRMVHAAQIWSYLHCSCTDCLNILTIYIYQHCWYCIGIFRMVLPLSMRDVEVCLSCLRCMWHKTDNIFTAPASNVFRCWTYVFDTMHNVGYQYPAQCYPLSWDFLMFVSVVQGARSTNLIIFSQPQVPELLYIQRTY